MQAFVKRTMAMTGLYKVVTFLVNFSAQRWQLVYCPQDFLPFELNQALGLVDKTALPE